MIGIVSRWGARGYGFVTSDELDGEAWLHVKFLDDPEYQPRQGDRVEFELERLPDGRYQARRVRLVSGIPGPRPRTLPPREALRAAHNGTHAGNGTVSSAPLSVKLAFDSSVLAAVRAAREEAEDEALFQRVAEPPRAVEAARAMPVAVFLQRSEGEAHEPAPAPPAAPPARLGDQLATARGARHHALESLREESEALAAEIARLEARRAALVAELSAHGEGDDGDARIVAAYLADRAAVLEHGLDEHTRRTEAFETARKYAMQRSGLPPVKEYLDIRERLRAAGRDELMVKAFSAFERERRAGLRDLADALDRVEAAEPVGARFVVFVTGGRSVLVAPVRAAAVEAGVAPAEIPVHIACAFWHTVERAARELGGVEAVIEHGTVAGLLAVRCGALDAGLLHLLLDETWSSRPSLESLDVEPEIEVVDGVTPPWEPEPELESDAVDLAAAGGTPAGFALPDVAARLGLSLHDLVATLYDRGLPFPDDEIDAGTEDTLRSLLGDEGPAAGEAPEPAEAAPPVVVAEEAPASGPEATQSIAGRMLKKLLRDRRVGGRHTRIENAYGHHFSDEEKRVARLVALWLEKDHIFIPKLNEGSHHISINPRRLRDVGQIIDGTWERRGELDVLARD